MEGDGYDVFFCFPYLSSLVLDLPKYLTLSEVMLPVCLTAVLLVKSVLVNMS